MKLTLDSCSNGGDGGKRGITQELQIAAASWDSEDSKSNLFILLIILHTYLNST